MKKPRAHWSTINPVPEPIQPAMMSPEQAEMFGYKQDSEFPGIYYPIKPELTRPAWQDRWNEKRRESDNDPAAPEQAWA
jgi:hypothetical protein